MKNKKVIPILVVILTLTIPAAGGQPVFYSHSLQKLYNDLPESCRTENPVADTVVSCTGILPGIVVPIEYCWDNYGILTHIGYRFLTAGMDTISNPAVGRFIEREVLTLLVTDNIEQKLISNHDNGLTLLLNGVTPQRSFYRSKNGLPMLLQHVSGMNIQYEAGKEYQVDLICGQNQILSFHFVADDELLSDMDKGERDKRLAAQLSHYHAKAQIGLQQIQSCSESEMQVYRDSAFVCKGSMFIIPQINSDIYYKKEGRDFQLLFSKNWVAETFSNAMLAPVKSNYTVQITQRMYGSEQRRYEINSLDFFDYFSGSYERYFGIESVEKDMLTGTLIFVNKSTGNIHLAFVSISLWNLFNGGTMKIQLDANIPQHNVETIFGRNKKEKSDYPFINK